MSAIINTDNIFFYWSLALFKVLYTDEHFRLTTDLWGGTVDVIERHSFSSSPSHKLAVIFPGYVASPKFLHSLLLLISASSKLRGILDSKAFGFGEISRSSLFKSMCFSILSGWTLWWCSCGWIDFVLLLTRTLPPRRHCNFCIYYNYGFKWKQRILLRLLVDVF